MTSNAQQKEKRILLVEDEPGYRSLILTILRKAGMNCTFCIDGDSAIKKLAQEKFDLLIIDYLLPGPSGIDVLRWARKQEINIPALIITGYPSDELSTISKSLGCTKVLAKPLFDVADMPNMIQEMFTNR